MTVGEALERLDELRPGSRIQMITRQNWLRELDGMLRARVISASGDVVFDAAGADLAWEDGLADETELLVPAPFDALYPHYLCAMTDAALGETDRYAGEMTRYNNLLAEFSVWLRRSCSPRRGAQWTW